MGPNARILVVEDTEIAREPLVRLLRHEGFEALGVTNGREALDALDAHRPDLVLLDILMPEMNGLEFLSVVRSHERWKDLPVIVLTAVRDDVCERDVKNLGVQGFIMKTGSPMEEVLSTMRGALGKTD